MDFLDPIKVKEYTGQPVTVAQVKFDGYYAEVYKDEDIIFICTKSQKVNIWPKLAKNRKIHKQVLSLPNNTILRCELHSPNVPATSVPTLVNEFDERLLLSPFCIELWGGEILSSLGPRYRGFNYPAFESENRLLKDHGFIVPLIQRLSCYNHGISEEIVKDLKKQAIELNVEGWVLKDKPRGNCYKIKPQLTVDAFVVDYTISDSDTYAGGLKSVDIAVWGPGTKKQIIIATVGTGFEGDYRMSVNPKSLIGRVGEFKYQTIGAKGRLIFPRFLRWRDDEKSKHECLITQLKGI